MGFRTRHHSPPTQKNSRRNGRQSDGYSHGWWLEIRRATTTKRRAQNKPLARHPARGLNLRDHINQEAHDARGSNTGLGMAVLGGAPLCHSCYGSKSRTNWLYLYSLNDKAVKLRFTVTARSQRGRGSRRSRKPTHLLKY